MLLQNCNGTVKQNFQLFTCFCVDIGVDVRSCNGSVKQIFRICRESVVQHQIMDLFLHLFGLGLLVLADFRHRIRSKRMELRFLEVSSPSRHSLHRNFPHPIYSQEILLSQKAGHLLANAVPTLRQSIGKLF